jgi:hypothetical protein
MGSIEMVDKKFDIRLWKWFSQASESETLFDRAVAFQVLEYPDKAAMATNPRQRKIHIPA